MRRPTPVVLSLAALLAAGVTSGLGAGSLGAAQAAGQQAKRSYIVVLEPGAAASTVSQRQARRHDAEVSHVYRSALKGYSASMTAADATALEQTGNVRYVQLDGVATASAQTTPTGIDRADADLSPTAAIDGSDRRVDVDVAVIDSGVNLAHPDLNVQTARAKNCSTGRSAEDGNGHGTHVAGTIGALDNGAGVAGMAPGSRIWPVRVLDNRGSGSFSAIVCGIDYVTANADKIEVANMSLGGGGADDRNCGKTNRDAMHQAICRSVAAGVTYVVAAGNETDDAARHVPAAYDEVITVSALADFNGRPGGGAAPTCRSDVDDTLADFSNYGRDVDLIAPGVCIASTWKGGGSNTISGTSMASPHVAGGAALVAATSPSAPPGSIKTALQSAATSEWNDVDDKDTVKEKLLNAAGY